ncbi:hypothetical protein BGW38_003906, partial [Lunasporangiospora selenospora]
KSPSKVFLLKKSFDYICNLKCEVAQRDLELAQLRAQNEYMKTAMMSWWMTLVEEKNLTGQDMDPETLWASWAMSEEALKQTTFREAAAAAAAKDVAELSAAAVEVVSQGNQQSGQGKNASKDSGKDSQGEDSDEEAPAPKFSKKNGSSKVSMSNGDGKLSMSMTTTTSMATTASMDVDMKSFEQSRSIPAKKTGDSGAEATDAQDEEEEEEEDG